MLMYVGAGLQALGFIFSLITRGPGASSIPGTLIGVGLWIWMAKANQAGKNWARITSTIFFGIDCLFLLLVLIGVGVDMHTVSSSLETDLVVVVAGVVVWAVGLVTIVLMWRRESSEYYAAMKGR
jgi:Na+/citrate or Na+/malate symporter